MKKTDKNVDVSKINRQLKLSQEKIASIFSAAPIGIGVVTDRILIEVNERLCDIIGYNKDELVGKSSRILYPSQKEYEWVGKEKYEQISKYGTGSVETKWKRKDGRIIEVLLSSTPLDVNDLKKGVTFTALDITQQKKDAFALRMSEQRFRNIANYTYDWEIWLSIHGTVLWMNPAVERIAGYTVDECLMIKNFPLPLIHSEDRDMVDTAIKLSLKGTEFDNFEFRIYSKDDKLKWISMCCQPISDINGAPQGVRISLRDITARKRVDVALHNFIKFTDAKLGKAFFDSLTTHLAQTINADIVLVGQLNEKQDKIQTMSVFKDGMIVDNFQYILKGSPCEHVIGKSLCTHESDVVKDFPNDKGLKNWGIEGYVGVPLFDSNGFQLGIIVALFRDTLEETHFIEDILQLFASRTATEIERNNYELAFLKRLNYEDLISEISAMLTDIDTKKSNTTINSALGEIAKFTSADSAYVFEFSDDLKHFSMTHLWKNVFVETNIEHMQKFNCADMPWWISRIVSRQPVIATSIDDLPEQAYLEKRIIRSQNIKSIIDVPLSFENRVIGFIGMSSTVDKRMWNEDDISLLRIVGQLITNAIFHKKAAQNR